jgi:hypothetical protein
MSADRVTVVLPPPRSNTAWRGLRALFQEEHTDTLAEVRGVGKALDTNPLLTVGYVFPPTQQRDAVASGLYAQGRRGSMAPIPTSQQLIQQVTGVPDATQRGR